MKTSLWPALQKAKLQELLLVTEANMINLEVFIFESYLRHRLMTEGGYVATSLENVLIQLSDALKALGTKKSVEQIVCFGNINLEFKTPNWNLKIFFTDMIMMRRWVYLMVWLEWAPEEWI